MNYIEVARMMKRAADPTGQTMWDRVFGTSAHTQAVNELGFNAPTGGSPGDYYDQVSKHIDRRLAAEMARQQNEADMQAKADAIQEQAQQAEQQKILANLKTQWANDPRTKGMAMPTDQQFMASFNRQGQQATQPQQTVATTAPQPVKQPTIPKQPVQNQSRATAGRNSLRQEQQRLDNNLGIARVQDKMVAQGTMPTRGSGSITYTKRDPETKQPIQTVTSSFGRPTQQQSPALANASKPVAQAAPPPPKTNNVPIRPGYQKFNRNNLSGYSQDQINAINTAAQKYGIKNNQINRVRFGTNGQLTGINGIGL